MKILVTIWFKLSEVMMDSSRVAQLEHRDSIFLLVQVRMQEVRDFFLLV